MLVVQDPVPGVRRLMLNRPDKLNAFDAEQYRECANVLDAARTDSQVRAVILCGAGSSFSAGHDRNALGLAQPQREASASAFHEFVDALVRFDLPLLAAVEGVAIGIGMTLLAHCDLVVMAEGARFRAPFVHIGITPEAGSSVLLPAILGWHRACEALLTGRWLSASELSRAGFGTEVVPDGAAVSRAVELATAIAQVRRREALVVTKRLLLAARAELVERARDRERVALADLFGSRPLGLPDL